jgi:parallel beta-helix repeat protein
MKTILFTFLFLCLLSSNILPAVYYINSENGNDNNSGTSADNSWKSLRKVNYFTFKPGDSVLFKKNSTWKGQLLITQNGSPGNPVVYSNYGSGNLPVIDGNNSEHYCIYVNNSSLVTVDGFEVINSGKNDGINIEVKGCEHCVIKNCKIIVNMRAGILPENCNYCIIQNNNINTLNAFIPDQADCIYAQRNSNNVYDGNNIVNYNKSEEQHADCIQLYLETDAVVKNNYLEQNNTKLGNAQGLYCTMPYGTHIYFNNIIYCPNTNAQLMGFLLLKKGTGTVRVLNNTLVGGKMNVFRTDDTKPVIRNNIFVTNGNYSMVRFDSPLNQSADINYNLYYSQKNKPVNYMNYEYSFSDWQNMDHEKNGLNKDPKLDKDNLLGPSSPAKNKGTDISHLMYSGKTVNVNSKGKKFDIGAYR